ncbi:Zn-dependent alcohol dehydrogenase [Novosphingobium malaysiense]|uniref:Alcohol dehydrogenase n=1 Tax=Novosphingobium malaysiense TaxID=1348853 RepID=A0A0B1ZEL1_9SPHN|nr:Zn-dependent alcohol dehydrogenase [Novosphingobium malaysiense]KHK88955.1 alcohol dehydrogenase [Novosphingobium malaysiense]
MKAAVFQEVGAPLTIEDLELDGPRRGEIRVRIVASGLCHSDYHLISGHLPGRGLTVLGHEAAGYIEAVGEDVPDLKVGDFVVTSFSAYCGECADCQTGHNHRCEVRPRAPVREAGSRLTWKGKPVWQAADIGGFAEEMVVHYRSAVKLPGNVPPEAAALLGCGVLTGAGAAINGAKIRPGSKAVVIGCGGVGLNTIQGARIAGAEQIIAVDVNQAKLDMARKFGATAAVMAGPNAVEEVRELSGGGVDFAFEVVGSPATSRDAFAMLRKHGTLLLIGMPAMGAEMSFPILEMLYKDIRIIPSGMGDVPFQLFLPQLARYYMDGRLMLDELVSKKIALADINEGFAAMNGGEIARSVIVF